MDRMIYLAANGAKQVMNRQASHTHMLANASTTGFKAALSAARAQPVFGDGLNSRVFTMAEEPGMDLSAGPIRATGRDLDVAINGTGWIAVQSRDGGEAYTRAGDLRITPTGQLTNGAGYAVLGDGGPIVLPPFENLEIGADGTLTIQPVGQAPSTLAVVERIKLVDPPEDELERGRDGLMRVRGGGVSPASASVTLLNGALEGSNVEIVHAMTSTIELARQFENQLQMMRTAQQLDESTDELMRLG
jgi:flagellar basal-body rod protein FlgF